MTWSAGLLVREVMFSPRTVWHLLNQEAQMKVYIGVDLHVRTQTVCWCDTRTGEQQERLLDHERDDVRSFYVQFVAPAVVGVEGSGYSLWFHRLMEEAGHHLVVGYAPASRQL